MELANNHFLGFNRDLRLVSLHAIIFHFDSLPHSTMSFD